MVAQRGWRLLPELLITGGLVAASTGLRTAASHLRIGLQHLPEIIDLAVQTTGQDESAVRAQACLRDEAMQIARETVEATWLEARRGLDQFDLAIRDDEPLEAAVRWGRHKQ